MKSLPGLLFLEALLRRKAALNKYLELLDFFVVGFVVDVVMHSFGLTSMGLICSPNCSNDIISFFLTKML